MSGIDIGLPMPTHGEYTLIMSGNLTLGQQQPDGDQVYMHPSSPPPHPLPPAVVLVVLGK